MKFSFTFKILDANFINFSDLKTDFDQFREHIIDNNFTHFLLISDGLNYMGENQKYNFGKKKLELHCVSFH